MDVGTFRHELDHPQRRLTTVVAGPLGIADITAHLAARELEGAMEYDHLIDLRQSRFILSADDMQRLALQAHRKSQIYQLGRTAFLVADNYSFGMLRIFCALAEPDCTATVVRSPDEAMEWLGWKTPGSQLCTGAVGTEGS